MFLSRRGAQTTITHHHNSSLSSLSAIQLGAHAFKGKKASSTNIQGQLQIANSTAAAVERAGIKPEDVEEVFVGNVLSAK
jgi:acetyl-CoA C-acetyltransferase